MFQQLLTIGRNTFLESIRQPIYLVLILAGCLLLAFSPQLATFTMDDDNKLLVDIGLSIIFTMGLFIACFTAASVLTSEIEHMTVLTVVSKPVARPVFIVGKFLGVTAAVLMATGILACLFLLTIRHGVMQTARDQFDQPVLTFGILAFLVAFLLATGGNYLYRWVFPATFTLSLAAGLLTATLLVLMIDKQWQAQSIFAELRPAGTLAGGQRLIALAMVAQALLILCAVALAASTRLSTVMTLVACLVFLTAALVTGQALHPYKDQPLFAALYYLVPNLAYFWQTDALAQQHAIPPSHLALVAVYATLWVTAGLALAIALFQTREVG